MVDVSAVDLMIPADSRDVFEESLRQAPTLLENLFWGALLGYTGGWHIYIEELMISDLVGPYNEPDNFVGIP